MKRRWNQGMSLIGILVLSVIVALTCTAILRYLRNITRMKSKVQKTTSATSIDGNVRGLIGNRLSCLESFATTRLDYSIIDTEQKPIVLYEKMGTAAAATPVFATGAHVNGVTIREVGATIGPTKGNANMIRVRITMEKRTDDTQSITQTQYYYVHTLRSGGAVNECYYVEGSDKLTLVTYEDVVVPASSTNPRASQTMTDPPGSPNERFGPPTWETLPTLNPNPNLPCSDVAVGAEVACPTQLSPEKPITVRGNLLVYSFQTRVSTGIGCSRVNRDFMDWWAWPTAPGVYYYMRPAGFGVHLGVRLLSGGALVQADYASISERFNDINQFHQQSLTTSELNAEVTYGQPYAFQMSFGMSGAPPVKPIYYYIPPPPPPPPGVLPPPPPPIEPRWSFAFANYRPMQGTVFHYIRTNAPAPPPP